MPRLSAFTPLGIFRLSAKPSEAQNIYNALVGSLGGNYNVEHGSRMDGFCYALALALARRGAHVVAVARTQGGLEELDDDIRKHGHVLTPGRYVGATEQEDDSEPFDEKMIRLATLWRKQRTAGCKLDAAIAANLKELGYGE